MNATARTMIFVQNDQIPNFSICCRITITASIHDLAQIIISLDSTITGLPIITKHNNTTLQFTFADKSIIDQTLLLSDIGILSESLITFSLKPDYHPLIISLEIQQFNVSISNIHLGYFKLPYGFTYQLTDLIIKWMQQHFPNVSMPQSDKCYMIDLSIKTT